MPNNTMNELNDAEKLFRESGIATDPEDMTEQIDIDELNDEALQLAMEMVDNLAKVYWDKEFMGEHPYLKKRIDYAIESMRLLIKNRKSNERLHDILLKSITQNPSNASLYRAETQNTLALLSIQKQIDETITGLNNMMKGFQLELNFNQMSEASENSDTSQPGTSVHRGSKSFIEQMRQKNSTEQMEMLFDTTSEDPVEQMLADAGEA